MTRPVLMTSLAAILGSALLLAGCNRDTPAPATTPTPTPQPTSEPEPPPPPAPASVTGVELGNAIDGQNRIRASTTEFAIDDVIYASVGTDGDQAARITVRWTFGEEGRLVRQTDADVAAGPQAIAFNIRNAEAWPPGNYKVEVMLNGTVVEAREFSVK